MTTKSAPITYHWRTFAEFSTTELYRLLQLRQRVFVVEQNCPYLDADGLDEEAWHLLGWRVAEGESELVACLRLIFPGKKFSGPAIGRLVTAEAVRSQGVGRELMQKALHQAQLKWPGQAVTISAQHYLEDFYRRIGFVAVSPPYDEDGILHLDMTFRPRPAAAKMTLLSPPRGT